MGLRPRFPQNDLIFFYNLNFKIVKINRLNKIILIKPSLRMPFKFVYSGVQPDRSSQVDFISGLLKRAKDLMCAGIAAAVAYGRVPDHTIVFPFFCP